MPKLGRGRILIWEGGSLWIMEAVSATRQRARLNEPHSHHAVQVTLALDGDFEFESGAHRVAGEVVAACSRSFKSCPNVVPGALPPRPSSKATNRWRVLEVSISRISPPT